MKPFSISATYCELQKTEETVSKQSIESSLRSKGCESRARSRIAAIVRRARVKRDNAYHQADKVIQEAHNKALELEATWKEEAQRQAVREAITWLVQQTDIERNLIDNMKDRIRHQMRSVIEKWSNKQDVSHFMIKQLSDHVAHQSGQSNLILFVPEEHYLAMEKAFSGQLKVEIKPELHGAQAELSSEYLVVRFDLDLQLQLLLDSFSKNNMFKTRASGE